jgi:hypothetical protein
MIDDNVIDHFLSIGFNLKIYRSSIGKKMIVISLYNGRIITSYYNILIETANLYYQINFIDISLRIIYLSKNLESNNETFKSYIIDISLNFFSNY